MSFDRFINNNVTMWIGVDSTAYVVSVGGTKHHPLLHMLSDSQRNDTWPWSLSVVQRILEGLEKYYIIISV
jgi:hypothetical protein